jgi:general secretion pathway protein G
MGQYPDMLDQLITAPAVLGRWSGPYIGAEGLRDPWGKAYHYRRPGPEGQPFDLWSSGPDWTSGTSDDITSWPQE